MVPLVLASLQLSVLRGDGGKRCAMLLMPQISSVKGHIMFDYRYRCQTGVKYHEIGYEKAEPLRVRALVDHDGHFGWNLIVAGVVSVNKEVQLVSVYYVNGSSRCVFASPCCRLRAEMTLCFSAGERLLRCGSDC